MTSHIQQAPSRERILDAAITRFRQYGYAGTSLSTIAKDVGVSTPALYWHFRSKDEIYYTALKELLRRFIDYVNGAIKAEDPVDRLAEIVTAHVTWQLEQADAASAYDSSVGMRDLVGSLPADQQAELKSLERSYLDTVRRTLLDGQAVGDFDPGDVRVTAFAILTMCEFVHSWYNPNGPLSISEVAHRLATSVLRTAGVTPERLRRAMGPQAFEG